MWTYLDRARLVTRKDDPRHEGRLVAITQRGPLLGKVVWCDHRWTSTEEMDNLAEGIPS